MCSVCTPCAGHEELQVSFPNWAAKSRLPCASSVNTHNYTDPHQTAPHFPVNLRCQLGARRARHTRGTQARYARVDRRGTDRTREASGPRRRPPAGRRGLAGQHAHAWRGSAAVGAQAASHGLHGGQPPGAHGARLLHGRCGGVRPLGGCGTARAAFPRCPPGSAAWSPGTHGAAVARDQRTAQRAARTAAAGRRCGLGDARGQAAGKGAAAAAARALPRRRRRWRRRGTTGQPRRPEAVRFTAAAGGRGGQAVPSRAGQRRCAASTPARRRLRARGPSDRALWQPTGAQAASARRAHTRGGARARASGRSLLAARPSRGGGQVRW